MLLLHLGWVTPWPQKRCAYGACRPVGMQAIGGANMLDKTDRIL